MNTDDMNLDAHLNQEELDLLLEDGREPEQGRRRAERHLERCAACRREATALESLHARLSMLPRLTPSREFAERIMSRVRLPVPWYWRMWAMVRERLLVVTSTLIAVTAGAGAAAWWLLGRPEALLPSNVPEAALETVRALILRAAILAGRLAYDIGAVDLVGRVLQGVEPIHLLAILAAVGTAGLAALVSAMKLMEASPLRRRRA